MEGKGRGGGAQPLNTIATTSAAHEPVVVGEPQPQSQQGGGGGGGGPPPRRRAGGQKRKASTSNTSSASAKRQARERSLSAIPPSLQHNGPITRARQSPNKFAAAEAAAVAAALAASAAAAAASAGAQAVPSGSSVSVKPSEALPSKVTSAAGGVTAATEESNKSSSEQLEARLEPAVDEEFEALRSREDNVHVIPVPAGWFSWTKVHPLEEHALPSFFNGKSEKRTPEIYMEIRNLIMKKFHEDVKTQFEPKYLMELSVGELDARQEVMEFLDHWGLINFHPFPLADSGTTAASANVDADGASKIASLVERLYHFETVQPRQRVGSKADLAAPTLLPTLIPESSFAEEVRPEGPAVEYHCNSCSADCSRKRYHCQKQADFDLCSECYNDGKFDSGMSRADFILMEPAEVPGVSGGSWTDQETLLLLEALELYGENWNEIAEHVATKTKAQCILHFVQMPIEDTFFEDMDDLDATIQEDVNPGSTGDDLAIKDATETRESGVETNNHSSPSKHPLDTKATASAANNDSSDLNDAPEKEEAPEALKSDVAVKEKPPLSSSIDISNTKDASEVKLAQEMSANCVLNALKEAFQAVGSLPESGGLLSFAEAGNPVMALAAFLAGLVEPDFAAASARSSLKAVSDDCHGIQLAARHCFILEDSPDVTDASPVVESADAEMIDQEAQKDENQKDEKQVGENQEGEIQKDENQKNEIQEDEHLKDEDQNEDHQKDEKEKEENQKVESVKDEKKRDENQNDDNQKNEKQLEENEEGKQKEVIQVNHQQDSNDVPKCNPTKDVHEVIAEEKKSVDDEGKEESIPVKEQDNETNPMDAILNSAKESADSALPGDPPSAIEESIDMPLSAEGTPSCVKEPDDGVGEVPRCSTVPKDMDIVSDLVQTEEKGSQRMVASSSSVDNGAHAENDDKRMGDCKEEKNCDLMESKDDYNVDRIKRAASTAISAAAVKAKFLANQEEDQIRQLVTFLIERQLYKLETKLSFLTDMESAISRVREQMDRSRQKLYHERAQIIATRLGLPASASRTIPSTLPNSRVAMAYANSMPRPQPGMNFQRPPFRMNPRTSVPNMSNSFSASSAAGASSHASK